MVEVPQQHAIQGANARNQIFASLRRDHELDEFVDRRIRDSAQIAPALALRRLARPEFALLVAGGIRVWNPLRRHVEVEGIHALPILGGIYRAHGGLDPKALQILLEWKRSPLQARRRAA